MFYHRVGAKRKERQGATIQLSLYDYIRYGSFRRWSLIMYGPPGIGKTPLAMLLCGRIAADVQQEDPWFAKCEDPDDLKDISAGLTTNVPILLDDVTPTEPKKGNPLTIEEVKHMTNVQLSESISGRFRNAKIPQFTPRIFTSNATSPHAWLNCIPFGIEEMTPAARVHSVSVDGMAIMKRCCFLSVTENFQTEEQCDEYWAKVCQATSHKMRRQADEMQD